MNDWLPPLCMLADHGHDWPSYIEAVYSIFHRDFVADKPHFRGVRLGLKRFPMLLDKERTFWHFISEGPDEMSRGLDEQRCQRMSWPKALIEGEGERGLPVWEERRNGEKRIVISLEDFSYVVVLAERTGANGTYYLPWTAYYSVGHRQRRHEQTWRKFRI